MAFGRKKVVAPKELPPLNEEEEIVNDEIIEMDIEEPVSVPEVKPKVVKPKVEPVPVAAAPEILEAPVDILVKDEYRIVAMGIDNVTGRIITTIESSKSFEEKIGIVYPMDD